MTTPETNEYRDMRLANLKKLVEMGHKPFGQAFERSGRIGAEKAAFADAKRVRLAGRLTAIRDMGKSIFADLSDGSGRIQIYAQKNHMGEESYNAFKLLDLGDHIGVDGTFFVTRMGEQSLKVDKWTMLSKALLPLPEKWHGLKDVDARYRQRYLDLIANPEVRTLFEKRSRAIQEIRNFLIGRGYFEVETPMIQQQAGGAAAKPFKTHYDALHSDMFLRIAPELYLKRLLVGGYDKVFELNRCFRNEGLDRTHNPEFTIMEIYEAYSDMRGMQKLVQDLVSHVALTVFGSLKCPAAEGVEPVDLTAPWREAPYKDLILAKMGDDWYGLPKEAAKQKAEQLGLAIDPAWGMAEITHEVFEKVIQKTLRQPTFVTRLPANLIPLAKTCPDDSTCADVFELVIGGQEIAPAYSELNDPLEQRRRLEEQAGPDAEKVEEDFLAALEHGMPPAGGMGIGIDRLIMIYTGSDAIRDVILFPQLKPKA